MAANDFERAIEKSTGLTVEELRATHLKDLPTFSGATPSRPTTFSELEVSEDIAIELCDDLSLLFNNLAHFIHHH